MVASQRYNHMRFLLVRIAQINSSVNNFVLDCRNLMNKLKRQSLMLLPFANVAKCLYINIFIFGENLV